MKTDKNNDSERRARQRRYFSESFKKKKVRELEKNLTTVAEVSRQYEVSRTSIYKWLNKYSQQYKRKHRQVIEPKSDTHKIKHLKERIAELEQLLGQKQMQLEYHQKLIELAEQELDIQIKKTSISPLSSGSEFTKPDTTGE